MPVSKPALDPLSVTAYSGSASTTRAYAPQHRVDAVADVIEYFRHAVVPCSPKHAAGVNRAPALTEVAMSVKKPALDPRAVEPESRSGYPPPYAARVLPREVRRLGERLGLTRIGVNLATLLPGKESSMRHWHTHEDEFVYVLEGEVVLRTDAGEQRLTAGMCAGFAAGSRDGHQLINRSAQPVVYLEISNRHPDDAGHYSDPDVDLVWNAPHARGRFTRRDGTPY